MGNQSESRAFGLCNHRGFPFIVSRMAFIPPTSVAPSLGHVRDSCGTHRNGAGLCPWGFRNGGSTARAPQSSANPWREACPHATGWARPKSDECTFLTRFSQSRPGPCPGRGRWTWVVPFSPSELLPPRPKGVGVSDPGLRPPRAGPVGESGQTLTANAILSGWSGSKSAGIFGFYGANSTPIL